MNTLITPEDFMTKFNSVVNKYAITLRDKWNAPNKFTKIFLGEKFSGGIMRELAKNLELRYYREYYTLDAIFYKRKDEGISDKSAEGALYAESICIALEHENNVNSSYIEMNKLAIFNTPLKVLVTYPSGKQKAEKFLTQYASILTKADIFSDFSTLRRHMVIFGKLNKDRKPIWSYYVYKNKRFIPLEI